MWDSFSLLIFVTAPIGLFIVFRSVWRAYRLRKKSLATAVAVTCIVFMVPMTFLAIFMENREPTAFTQAVQTGGIVLMFAAGITGAIGLVRDRKIAMPHSKAETNDGGPGNFSDSATARSEITDDQQIK